MDIKKIGNINSINQEGNSIYIKLDHEGVKVNFFKEDIVRIYLDPTGEFGDDTQSKIIAQTEGEFIDKFGIPTLAIVEKENYYSIASEKVVLHFYKKPFKVEAYKKDEKTLIFKEIEPISYTKEQIIQTLEGDETEYFYGGGVQNGQFSHKNKKIEIELKISHWNAGSVSSPAPFYMSTKGYGQFRNTFQKGSYAFFDTTVLTHQEGKSDTFYFFGETLGDILNLYTELTGKPNFIPRWGLMPGDANCYKETMDALKVANQYVEHNIPRGWILPNDGYGCGYTDLKGFVAEAEKLGFKVGLWTENSMEKLAQEVGEFGSRVVKTDVAWVGPGYEFGLDGVKQCFDGIEDNCEDRAYLWTCCGWAGTQRYSTVWSGDQFGDWEYIRMHIPTYIGSGLSANPYCGSDVDAIFAGAANTQVRDLQWKCFTPILIQMSGWAPKDKQPWVWGEPYTTYNRTYLNLKLRLTPYMYTYAHQSYVDATPIMRPMLWDYSNESYTLTKDTQYQFMLGEYFLVAPIFEDTEVRDCIYLPDENQMWIDYFTGEGYQGGRVLNSFKAPLQKLPLFVKNGAIIPMYPLGRFDGDVVPDEAHPLTLDIYPCGETHFELYEDDGSTKEHKQGAFAETMIKVKAPQTKDEPLVIHVGNTIGSYRGIKENRKYEFAIHTKVNPGKVIFNVKDDVFEVQEVQTKEIYESTESNVMHFDKEVVGGVLLIKTQAINIREGLELKVEHFNNDTVVGAVTDEVLPEGPVLLEAKEVFDTKTIIGWQEVAGATGYDLLIDGLFFTNVSNPYAHRELEFTTTYTYQVRAYNTLGVSPWSEQIKVTTLESSLKDVITGEEMNVTATSERPGYKAAKAVNGDGGSMWLTESKDETDLPATYTMTFKDAYKINKFEYKSRAKGTKGNITKYNLFISQDGTHYKDLVREGIWMDQEESHLVDFSEEVVKYLKLEALEGNENYANAIHLKPYKVPGTDTILLGDYTGGGQVDNNDFTFVSNYIGVFEEDNDWGYVSKCDINYNGMIDAYDLAFVSSRLEGGLVPSEVELAGSITVETSALEVKEGEIFEVNVIGHDLKDVYAFHAMLNLDIEKFEHTNCMGRCKKEVIAKSSDLSCHMSNATTIKSDENGAKIVIAFTGKGNTETINESGVLSTFTLKAKQDTKVELDVISTMLVGSKLTVIEKK
ncbi:MAG: glycoside hydrolase family 31 protein [Cellulosilyticaceae bacterium]